MSLRFQKADISGLQDLSAAGGTALSATTSTGRKFKLIEVTVNADENITETITVTRVSKLGSDYDDVLAKRDLVSEQHFIFRPQGECLFQAGDEVKVECTANEATGEVFYNIKRVELP